MSLGQVSKYQLIALAVAFQGVGEKAERLQVVVRREVARLLPDGKWVRIFPHRRSAVDHLPKGIAVSGSATWPTVTFLELECSLIFFTCLHLQVTLLLWACCFRPFISNFWAYLHVDNRLT